MPKDIQEELNELEFEESNKPRIIIAFFMLLLFGIPMLISTFSQPQYSKDLRQEKAEIIDVKPRSYAAGRIQVTDFQYFLKYPNGKEMKLTLACCVESTYRGPVLIVYKQNLETGTWEPWTIQHAPQPITK